MKMNDVMLAGMTDAVGHFFPTTQGQMEVWKLDDHDTAAGAAGLDDDAAKAAVD